MADSHVGSWRSSSPRRKKSGGWKLFLRRKAAGELVSAECDDARTQLTSLLADLDEAIAQLHHKTDQQDTLVQQIVNAQQKQATQRPMMDPGLKEETRKLLMCARVASMDVLVYESDAVSSRTGKSKQVSTTTSRIFEVN